VMVADDYWGDESVTGGWLETDPWMSSRGRKGTAKKGRAEAGGKKGPF